MQGDDKKRVTRGSPLRISARVWNETLTTNEEFRRSRKSGQKSTPQIVMPGTVYIRNDSGSDLSQFSVLGLGEIVISPTDNEREFRNRVVMSAVVPDKYSHRGRFCILAEPLKAGRIGRAFIDSVCQVRLNVPSGSTEPQAAEIEDGATGYLTAAVYGSASILWREGGSGEQWAVVRFGTMPAQFPVKLTQAGGAHGNASTAASWIYNVVDPVTNVTIESGVDPVTSPHNWKRPAVGWINEATAGLAHFNGNGALVLDWINEIAEQEACEEEA